MKHGAVVLILFCAFLSVLVCAPPAGASTFSWTAGTPTVYRSESAVAEDLPDCPTYMQQLQIEGLADERSVCVLGGDGFRVGSFRDAGTSRAVVTYPLDGDFHVLSGVCEGLAGCLYSSDRDTLVSRYGNGIRAYDGVRGRIRQTIELGFVRYDFDASNPLYTTQEGVPVGAIALSRNGKWLVVEIKNFGIGLVNLETGLARRIVAPGYQYGRGFDPREELAVSNDGTSVVVTGDNAGLMVVSIDSGCGDELTASLAPSFAFGVRACQTVGIDTTVFTQSFNVGFSPRFDDSGGQLEFVAGSRGLGAKRVVLRASGFVGEPQLDYLALGDSFSSGEGETSDRYYEPGTNNGLDKCHISTRSYPFLLATAMQLSYSGVKSVACSGAKTTDIVAHGVGYLGQEGRLGVLGLQLSSTDLLSARANSLPGFLPGIVPQEAFVQRYQPSVVSVGIGGNDAGFMDKLKVCAMPGTCEWAATQSGRYSIALEIQGLFYKLVTLYQQLRLDSPFSHFYAVGYPEIIDPGGACDSLTSTLFNVTERNLVKEGIDYLDNVIKTAASTAKVPYLDIERSLAGRELCQSSNLPSAVNGLRFGDDIAPTGLLPMLKIIGKESFHPTPTGHELMAQAILQQQPDLRTASTCDNCVSSGQPPPLPDGWDNPGGSVRGQPTIANFVSPADVARSASTISFSLPAGSLEPGSIAHLEVHSDPLKLGAFTARDDGSVMGEAHLPLSLEDGFHTVHLYGDSFSRQPVDVYQVISFGDPAGENLPGELTKNSPDQQDPTSILDKSAALSSTSSRTPADTTHALVLSRRQSIPWVLASGLVVGILVLASLVVGLVRRNYTQDRGG